MIMPPAGYAGGIVASGMLQGFKVVELATHIAAPAAAGLMADWGADVIKIESIEGDPMRWLRAQAPGGCTPVFETNNRGKRSLSLNIASTEGRDIVRRLVREADVFLTNLRPNSLKRAKLDWDSLRGDNPALIYASVTGYGLQGPHANTPAFDNAAYWSRSGMADLTRPEGQDPFSIRQGSGDHTCALATALAIMTALLARTRTGQGRLVETSLLRTGVFIMGADLSNRLRLGEVTPTRVRHAAANPMNNFFKTADGRWVFVMPRGRHPDDWAKICIAAGALAPTKDARFATAEGRAANGAELVTALDRGFGAQTFDEVAKRLTAADVVWSPVQSPEQVISDPQAEAAGCFVQVSDGAGALFRAPGPPARFDADDGDPKRPVARLGQHTDAVLGELGFTAAEVERMRAEATIG
jgi:crotonobetainyl-CoA:carnitine CoA-transferase CaiB-like acyl-CoA transferase